MAQNNIPQNLSVSFDDLFNSFSFNEAPESSLLNCGSVTQDSQPNKRKKAAASSKRQKRTRAEAEFDELEYVITLLY